MSKILFLTTAHNYNDDRIFYHQARELKSQGFDVKISSLYSDFKGEIDGVEIESYDVLSKSTKEKLIVLEKICFEFQPDLIICSEPLAVVATKKYAKTYAVKIIYDITEWYPSMRMVRNYSSLFLKILHAVKLFLIQIYAGFLSDYFIFGEHTKKFPLAYFFPFRNNLILPYYPDDCYIEKNITKLKDNEIKVCFTGTISKEKGIESFFNALDCLRVVRPNLKVSIMIVGGTRSKEDEIFFSKLCSDFAWDNISIQKPVSFQKFTTSFSEADLCFDLRDLNFENNHCLPIKIFYYIAAGKPIIYTDLKAIRRHMDVSSFGHLVDPENSNEIAKIVIKYIDNPGLYDDHAKNARLAYEKKYHWGIIKDSFTNFVKQSLQKNK